MSSVVDQLDKAFKIASVCHDEFIPEFPENADVKKVEAEKETLAEENANLKAQLEALTKGKKDKEDEKSKSDKNDELDTEGF